jgi:hypothetical protein
MYVLILDGQGAARVARAAKPLKRLKTAMGGYWKKLAWIWVWRHSRLGLAPCPFGARAAKAWRSRLRPTSRRLRAAHPSQAGGRPWLNLVRLGSGLAHAFE